MVTLCAALLLAAPPAGLYRGAIGVADSLGDRKPFPIVMLLESPSEGVLKGRYFYWKQRRDIIVDGTYLDGRISLQEHGGDDGAVSGAFSGTFETSNWSGTWASSSKNRQLPVTMLRVGDGSMEELERWRRGLLRSTQSANGLTWEWRAARASPGIALPFLVKSRSAAVEKKVNAAMQMMLDQMGCESGGEWTTRSEVASSRRDVFSVSIHSSYYCGGPYPTNDANESATFDLRTSEKIEFWSLFSAPHEEVLKTLLAARIGEGSEPQGHEPARCGEKANAQGCPGVGGGTTASQIVSHPCRPRQRATAVTSSQGSSAALVSAPADADDSLEREVSGGVCGEVARDGVRHRARSPAGYARL